MEESVVIKFNLKLIWYDTFTCLHRSFPSSFSSPINQPNFLNPALHKGSHQALETQEKQHHQETEDKRLPNERVHACLQAQGYHPAAQRHRSNHLRPTPSFSSCSLVESPNRRVVVEFQMFPMLLLPLLHPLKQVLDARIGREFILPVISSTPSKPETCFF